MQITRNWIALLNDTSVVIAFHKHCIFVLGKLLIYCMSNMFLWEIPA